jgi:dTDP-4-amino-4,6-dideoxygalactose transaminase
MGFKRGYCPKAEAYFKQVISIPMYAGLQADQQCHVIKQLFMATTLPAAAYAEKMTA